MPGKAPRAGPFLYPELVRTGRHTSGLPGGGAVNGASNAAPAEQAGADGIHDGRRLLPGDVTPHKLNTGGNIGLHSGQRQVG